jgi:hypothetical protein
MHRKVLLLAACVATSTDLRAQDAAHAQYFRAVASYFSLPAEEVAILSDWGIPADEIPVVLFVARRSGVSPEAVVALRESGQSWQALTTRFRVSPAALHVPLRDDAPAGALDGAYSRFRSTPVGSWNTLQLEDAEVVGLVNVRMISQFLDRSVEEVAAASGTTGSYVELLAGLRRR